jgi:signal transduction histidine kinase
LLWLVFYNLLDNACKFTRPEDAIELRAVEDGHWLVVEVADTGIGIAEDDLPHLFEELYRGSNARGVEGSGLGLSLVQRVVTRHGAQPPGARGRLHGAPAFIYLNVFVTRLLHVVTHCHTNTTTVEHGRLIMWLRSRILDVTRACHEREANADRLKEWLTPTRLGG